MTATITVQVQQQDFDHMCTCWRDMLRALMVTGTEAVVAPWELPNPHGFERPGKWTCEHGILWHAMPSDAQAKRWETPEGRLTWWKNAHP